MSANRTRRSLTAGLTCVGALRRTSPHATSFLFRSGLAPRPLQTRGYAQPASNPDQDDGSIRHSAESDSQNSASNAGPSRRGGMSAEDKAKWAFPSKPNPSPYDILHLPKTASKSEIKQNYYRLAMIYHPDASHPSSSTDNFMALRNAYNLLKNEGTRTTYNRTGVGWSSNPSHSSSGESPSQWQDDMMREQIRRRANSYGNAYGRGRAHGYGRGEGAYSQARWGQHAHDSDYGFAGYAHAGPDRGSQTGNYMSNVRFVGSLAIVSVIFAIFQYDRASKSAESHRQQLRINHVKASEALAEARHDAALYGKERRDRIRRYVRSREVEKEYERMMSEAAENTALLHGEAIQPLEPDDRSNA